MSRVEGKAGGGYTVRCFALSLVMVLSLCVVSLAREVILPVPFITQHKDTWMLCLDGCSEGGSGAWDGPQLSEELSEHSQYYCVFASLAMITRYFGGDLSQDRIAYEVYGGHEPEGDLGHSLGVPGSRVAELLQWALGASNPPLVLDVSSNTAGFFGTFQGYIDQGRPFILAVPEGKNLLLLQRRVDHAVVVVGYDDDPRDPALIVHDPAFRPLNLFGVELGLGENARWSLRSLTTGEKVFWAGYAIVPPLEGQYSPRKDEYDLGRDLERSSGVLPGRDSDGDGVIDFDEVKRFHTNPRNPDSDGDGVSDLYEIRAYIFDEKGDYRPRDADCDHDGRRKELDVNNDGDCYCDGEEDTNFNGRRDPGERSNFEFDVECRWCGREGATIQVTAGGHVIRDRYHGPVEILEVATGKGERVLQGTATLDFSREYSSSFPGRITGITPAPPFVFRISGIREETPEGREFLRFKRTFEGNPLAVVVLDVHGRSTPVPDPGIIGAPTVFYAYSPQAMLTGSPSAFPQWIGDMEEIIFDPVTREVWLRVPVAVDSLHAAISNSRSFQETVRKGRNPVAISVAVDFSVELERGTQQE